MRLGAEGIRVNCGRLGGAEIARTEWYRGKSASSYVKSWCWLRCFKANTTYGICGVKVWIFKGEKFDRDGNDNESDNKISNEELTKVEK